jgi:F-type H+-transporting ATPase subunit delta
VKSMSVAGPWAQALLDAARERGSVDSCREGAAGLLTAVQEVPEIGAFLASPTVPVEEKEAAFVRALEGRVDPLLVDLARLVLNRMRAPFLAAILERIVILCDLAAGKQKVTVRTAVALGGPLAELIRAGLAGALGDRIEVEARTEPALLGGLVVEVGDRRADRSLARSLREIRKRLLAARMESEVHDVDPGR